MVVNRFVGLLAILTLVVTVAAVVALVTRRVPAWARDVALPVGTLIALGATLGSLYYSEVAGYPPCTLCWYQRIAIYPQVVVLGVAAWRRDREVWRTSVPLALIGIAFSVWHIVIEQVPSLAGPCDPSNPCTILWVEEFGFLTIPTMALVTGAALIATTLLARTDPVRSPRGARSPARRPRTDSFSHSSASHSSRSSVSSRSSPPARVRTSRRSTRSRARSPSMASRSPCLTRRTPRPRTRRSVCPRR